MNDGTDPEDSSESLHVGSESPVPGFVGSNTKHHTTPRSIQVNQNWFAKFFHIQPATKIICLNVSRPKARREVVKALKDWKKYGLRDVTVDKTRNLVFGRVDQVNCVWFLVMLLVYQMLTVLLVLKLKPVQFAGELFRVVEYGHRANLSIIRFTQERGAASSFYKVVETLQVILKERGLLVGDPSRAKKMARELARSGV